MDLIIREDELGIDIWETYQSSLFSIYGLPGFQMLFEDYKLNVLLKETEMSEEVVKRSLEALKQGTYDLSFTDLKTIKQMSELEYFDYLLKQGLSFKHNKQVFHSPAKEVW
jgi:hypothetical protein